MIPKNASEIFDTAEQLSFKTLEITNVMVRASVGLPIDKLAFAGSLLQAVALLQRASDALMIIPFTKGEKAP